VHVKTVCEYKCDLSVVGRLWDVQYHSTSEAEGEQLQGSSWDNSWSDEHWVCYTWLAS